MRHRVVLVDDVPEIRQILRLILEHAGPFEVVGEGCDGNDAVRLAADLAPDLIVMDVAMRGGPSGWQALPEIRKVAPGTAVVILSGSAADTNRGEGDAQADGVLEKGLPPQELHDALLAILGDPRTPTSPPNGDARRIAAAAPAAIRDAAGVLDAVLDATSDGVVEVDGEGRVVSWNRSAARIFDTPAGRAVGQPVASAAGPEVGRHVQRALDGSAVDGAPAGHGISLTVSPLRGGGALVVAHDASAARAGDEAMAWALAELEAKRLEVDRARRELEGFASVASHDLAQPLQVAYGYLEMVRTEFAEGMDETAAAWIESAVGSLERMRILVQDILAYARGGNREIEPRPVSVDDAARSALSALEAAIQERAADVRLRPPLPTVSGHDEHLANVLEKLLDNAVRYVPEDRTPIVEVFAEEADDEWIITVADNGAGIPAELTERVFDVFYRGARTTNRGTGLGLSLSRKLVGRMGGRIWVEPRADEADGTWIRFALPKDVT